MKWTQSILVFVRCLWGIAWGTFRYPGRTTYVNCATGEAAHLKAGDAGLEYVWLQHADVVNLHTGQPARKPVKAWIERVYPCDDFRNGAGI